MKSSEGMAGVAFHSLSLTDIRREESIDKGKGRKEGVVLVLSAQRRKDEPF